MNPQSVNFTAAQQQAFYQQQMLQAMGMHGGLGAHGPSGPLGPSPHMGPNMAQMHPRMNFIPPPGWTFVDPNQFYQPHQFSNKISRNGQVRHPSQYSGPMDPRAQNGPGRTVPNHVVSQPDPRFNDLDEKLNQMNISNQIPTEPIRLIDSPKNIPDSLQSADPQLTGKQSFTSDFNPIEHDHQKAKAGFQICFIKYISQTVASLNLKPFQSSKLYLNRWMKCLRKIIAVIHL